LTPPLLEYADLATTYASDAYLQAQRRLLADDDRIRRDLLDDLLAGREPDGGSGGRGERGWPNPKGRRAS
jgi:hypothetical protein